MSYVVGTRGVGDDCAPSYTLAQGADYEGLFIKAAVDQGWAVAISDYQGLGTPGPAHLHGRPRPGPRRPRHGPRRQRLPGTGLSSANPSA